MSYLWGPGGDPGESAYRDMPLLPESVEKTLLPSWIYSMKQINLDDKLVKVCMSCGIAGLVLNRQGLCIVCELGGEVITVGTWRQDRRRFHELGLQDRNYHGGQFNRGEW